MIAAPNRYALRPVRSPQEWAAYHAIRRQAIFAALLPDQAYDENDPDEVAPGNFPHVLLRDGEIVGVVRIDLIGRSRAGLPLVASGAISSGKATTASCSDLRKTPHAFSVKPRSSSMPTDLAAFYLANGYRQGEWGRRRTRYRPPSFAWESDCRDKDIPPFPDCRARVPDRAVGVTNAANRPQSPPLRGH
jgi:hypothetical protein